MRAFVPVILAAGLLYGMPALAHTHLVSSIPSDNATLAASPKEAILTFAEPVVLTNAKIDTSKGKKIVIKPPMGPSAKEARVPLPALAAGRHHMQWRAISDDGHIMTGELSFVIDPAAPH